MAPQPGQQQIAAQKAIIGESEKRVLCDKAARGTAECMKAVRERLVAIQLRETSRSEEECASMRESLRILKKRLFNLLTLMVSWWGPMQQIWSA